MKSSDFGIGTQLLEVMAPSPHWTSAEANAWEHGFDCAMNQLNEIEPTAFFACAQHGTFTYFHLAKDMEEVQKWLTTDHVDASSWWIIPVTTRHQVGKEFFS